MPLAAVALLVAIALFCGFWAGFAGSILFFYWVLVKRITG